MNFEMHELHLELNSVPSSMFAVGLTDNRTRIVLAQCAGNGTPWQITVVDKPTAVFIAKQIMDRVDELKQ